MGVLESMLWVAGIVGVGYVFKDQILEFIGQPPGPGPGPEPCTKTCTAPEVLDSETCTCVPDTPGPGPGPGPGPTPGTGTITLALTGDHGKNLGYPVAAQIVKNKPDYFIGLGDYGYDSFSGFKIVSDTFNKANIPMYLTEGNHDVGDNAAFLKVSVNPGGKWLWVKNFNQNLSIISLNSEASGSTKAEAENLLKQATGKFKIVIYHKPVYSCKAQSSLDEGKLASIHPLFSKYNVNMVFTGHNHFYWRHKPCPGMPMYFVVGTGGHDLNACRPPYGPCPTGEAYHSDKTYGFVLLTVSSAGMSGKYITESGKILDNFTA